jgi:ribonuclease I
MPLPRLRVALLFLAVLVIVNGEAFAFEHNMPGEFDYYALVLGWAPSYCLSEGRLRRNAECAPDKLRAFVLQGLWPQREDLLRPRPLPAGVRRERGRAAIVPFRQDRRSAR